MTKRTVKQKSRGTKPATRSTVKRVGKPVDSRPRREAAHATPIVHAEPRGLTADDRAALAKLGAVSGRPTPIVVEILSVLRATEASTDEIARGLRGQAHDLEFVAERLTPEPDIRDAMLRGALEIVEAAFCIFEYEGMPEKGLLAEALRAANADIELLGCAANGETGVPDVMAFLRAQYRIDLALKLDAFRKKHPTWKPADETEQAGDAS